MPSWALITGIAGTHQSCCFLSASALPGLVFCCCPPFSGRRAGRQPAACVLAAAACWPWSWLSQDSLQSEGAPSAAAPPPSALGVGCSASQPPVPALSVPCLCPRGRTGHHLPASPFPFGSLSPSSTSGTACPWRSGAGNCSLCEELAEVRVCNHCWVSVRELKKQVSRIRFSAVGPLFFLLLDFLDRSCFALD